MIYRCNNGEFILVHPVGMPWRTLIQGAASCRTRILRPLIYLGPTPSLNAGKCLAKVNFSLVVRHLQASGAKDAFLSAAHSEKVGFWKPSVCLPLFTCYPYDYTVLLQIRKERDIHSSDCKGVGFGMPSACLNVCQLVYHLQESENWRCV
jgi:hypothetical protein